MYPCTCALMLALMNPSSVATRSSTRGTSCGVTVVTSTSGGGGPVCAGLREQPAENDKQIRKVARAMSRFINFTIVDGWLKCRVQMHSLLLFASLAREFELTGYLALRRREP